MGADDEDDTDVENDTVAEAPAKRRRDAIRTEVGRGTMLGRYLVVEKIARGGMGVVFLAYDPELHRRVAIKLLLPEVSKSEDATAGRARLLREAQAMARLSHPNVIHVYDVGTFEDAVFLALEFIDGETVGKWIKGAQRSWQEVLRVFVAAGRGLAAAHAAGLVHRDFKPENVMIGKDGRVLVTDFGLARELGATAGDDPPQRDSNPSLSGEETPSQRSTPLSTPLTVYGTIMGTPGYAAPEQLTGGVMDARGDQFSFAASLYAGLYKTRPYPAKTFDQYRTLLKAGLPEPPPIKVPARVRRAVERGLAKEPQARFPSMDALLAELSRDPIARWRYPVLAATVLAIAAIVTPIVWAANRDKAAVCKATSEGAWDATHRERVKAQFLATNKSFAQSAFDAVAQRLDGRSSAWTAMRTEACEATRKRGEQPESVMVLRMSCLDRRANEMKELVGVFETADASVVERAVGATSALTPLDGCADIARLTAAIEPPKDPAKVGELRATIDKAKVLTDAGKYKDAHAIAKDAADAARKLAYRPLVAEALVQRGELESYLGDR